MKNSRLSSASAGRRTRSSIGLIVPVLFAVGIGWTGCSAGGSTGGPASGNATGGVNGSGGSATQYNASGGANTGSSGFTSSSTGGVISSSGSGGSDNSVKQVDGGAYVNPPVDPTIAFNWQGGDTQASNLVCQPGHYRGTFIGTYASPYLIGIGIPVLGDVQMYLQQGQNGEFLTITDGRVSGTVDGALAQYQCDIVGTLDCAKKKIINGGLTHCEYCVGFFLGDAAHPICGLPGYFQGPLGADYDAANEALVNGTWRGEEHADAGPYGGKGTWNANYVGP